MTSSNETRADHLELSLHTKVNHSPELSAARSSGWKRNAVRSATKRVVHMTDHDRLTVFRTCSLPIGLRSKVLCLRIILSFL
jgi:hypothetical protein